MSWVRRGDGCVRLLGRARGGGTLRGVCELVQRREGEWVAVQMLAVSSSLQTGDPGLKTRHLRLLDEQGLIRGLHGLLRGLELSLELGGLGSSLI